MAGNERNVGPAAAALPSAAPDLGPYRTQPATRWLGGQGGVRQGPRVRWALGGWRKMGAGPSPGCPTLKDSPRHLSSLAGPHIGPPLPFRPRRTLD